MTLTQQWRYLYLTGSSFYILFLANGIVSYKTSHFSEQGLFGPMHSARSKWLRPNRPRPTESARAKRLRPKSRVRVIFSRLYVRLNRTCSLVLNEIR